MIRSSLRAFSAATAAALMLAACGGGGHAGGGIVPQQPSGGNPVASNAGPSTFAWGSNLISKLPYDGPATNGGLTVAVMVHMQNAAGLVQYAKNASTPGSATYRKWLTPAQIAQEFGATQSNYQQVAKYFASYGLRVGAWPQREMLSVSGSMQQFSKAFGTTFGTYTYLGKKIIAPNRTPKFATTMPVDAVVGLASSVHPQTYLIHNNNASYYGYSPQQIATGFDYSGAYNAGFNGSGINVGIIGTGPILDANGNDDDTAALGSYWKASMGTVTQVAVSPQPATTANGGTGTGVSDDNQSELATPPPVTSPACSQADPNFPDYDTCNPEDGEAQLDTESVSSLAPGATTLFYLAFNPYEDCYDESTGQYELATGTTCPDPGYEPQQAEGIELTDDEIQQAIADNKADAISMSFGEPENIATYYGYIGTGSNVGLGQVEMASMVAEGMAVFASSGDDGAWECFDPATGAPLGTACVNYPASDTNVVAVGGVNIPLDEAGNLTGEISAWADNTTLGGNGAFENNVGSGGGVSTVFSSPAWQSTTISASVTNGMRVLPDISLDADPNTGPSVTIDAAYGLTPEAIGGTSAAAPEAAAQWAIVLQACKASSTCNQGGATGYRLGNPAPLLYAIYGTSSLAAGAYTVTGFTPQLTYAQTFYDVIYGDNQAVPSSATPQPASTPSGYSAGPGYDQVTGIGAPFTGHLIKAITGTTVP